MGGDVGHLAGQPQLLSLPLDLLQSHVWPRLDAISLVQLELTTRRLRGHGDRAAKAILEMESQSTVDTGELAQPQLAPGYAQSKEAFASYITVLAWPTLSVAPLDDCRCGLLTVAVPTFRRMSWKEQLMWEHSGVGFDSHLLQKAGTLLQLALSDPSVYVAQLLILVSQSVNCMESCRFCGIGSQREPSACWSSLLRP